MSPRAAPPPNARELLSLDGAVARFRADLARLIDVDDDRVLVAVSGGGDSVALLLLAHRVLGDRCVAATVDHRLRCGSAAEAAMVAALCAERGIAHATLTGDLAERVGRTANLSVRARRLRYGLLEQHAVAVGAAWLATAHHGDDQLETLLMRLNRGAGLAGLAGIRRRSGRLIRPLLGWRRADLAAVVADAGIAAVDDPSNVDDRFDRARLRKAIADAAWLDVERIGMSVAALGDAEEALAWATRQALAARGAMAEGSAWIDPCGLPYEIVRRLVHACVEHVDPAADPTGPGLLRMIDALRGERPAMLGEVLAKSRGDGGAGVRWHFRRAPPRRAT